MWAQNVNALNTQPRTLVHDSKRLILLKERVSLFEVLDLQKCQLFKFKVFYGGFGEQAPTLLLSKAPGPAGIELA